MPYSFDMSDQPNPTGKWTLVPRALHFNIMCGDVVIYEGVTSEVQGNALADAHNAALAAEREAYALALQMKNIETTRANEAEKQLADDREKHSYSKLHVDLAEARRDNETLVDALKEILRSDDLTVGVMAIGSLALAKVKAYPFPDGRTK